MPIWIAFGLASAVCAAFSGALQKSAVTRLSKRSALLLFKGAAALVFGTFATTLFSHSRDFWIVVLVGAPLNAIASYWALLALEESDLSLVAPLQSLTPLFMFVTGPLILGQSPSVLGCAGVILLVVGTYVICSQPREGGWFAPFKKIWEDRGCRYMVGSAFFSSVGSTIDVIGIRAGDKISWLVAINAMSFVCLLLFLKKGERLSSIDLGLQKGILFIVIAVLISCLGNWMQMLAYEQTLAVYVIALKRCAAVFSVLIGWLLFREPYPARRMVGAVVMAAGVILISNS